MYPLVLLVGAANVVHEHVVASLVDNMRVPPAHILTASADTLRTVKRTPPTATNPPPGTHRHTQTERETHAPISLGINLDKVSRLIALFALDGPCC